MNKLKMESVDMTQANIDRIAQMFPQVVTEVADPNGAVDENGKPVLKKAIDFEKLKLVLSAGTGDYVVADDERERYEFTWVGKRQAMIDAATPIRKTLRPCPEESKDWATTENLYIEGDNLEVLKLLQESYLGKVKMIYIDPPYNTGKDFIYKDNFAQSREKYEEELNMFDEDGNRLFQNTETNGRFHSDWCSMIYPRLQLARNLLTDDGVIFISIDDNEVENTIKIGKEIFGNDNSLVNAVWISGRTAASHFTNSHEYVIGFAKDIQSLPLFKYKSDDATITDRTIKKIGVKNPASEIDFPAGIDFECEDKVFPNRFGSSEIIEVTKGLLQCVNRKLKNPVTIKAGWAMKDMIENWINGNEVVDQKGQQVNRFFFKANGVLQYEKNKGTIHPNSIISDISTKQGTNMVEKLLGKPLFSFPKPIELIKYLSPMVDKKDIVLDFFSGSSTTAHAVMHLNAEDGGKRKFIMVQLPEVCDPNSEAAKAGYSTICEIGKERIRRAGEKINKERIDRIQKEAEKDGVVADIASLDTGFRVFKLDSTNMKDVYYAAGQLLQQDLWDTVSNIKDDRSDIDLLYGCLLDWGVYEGLQLPHTTEQIESFTVHTVDSPLTDEIDLIACFDSNVSETVVRTIAKRKPTRALFRDSSFADSANKINVFEIFKSISLDTNVKVI